MLVSDGWKGLMVAIQRQRPPVPKLVPRTTDSRQGKLVASNLLLDAAAPTGPNQVWVGAAVELTSRICHW